MPWPGNPQRDANGEVTPHDDPQMLPSGHHLIRHVLRIQTIPDHNQGGALRATSAAFSFSSDGSKSLSGDAWEPMQAAGLPPDHYASQQGKGAARFPVAAARGEALLVGVEPVAGNDHHCGVWQPSPPWGTNRTDKALRRLSRSAVLVVNPP